MSNSTEFWNGKRVLVTGHTGFKGSWLTLWLQSMGADICGLALAPSTTPDLYTLANVGKGIRSIEGDIRNYKTVEAAFDDFKPEIVLHLAAQPLVRLSYADPIMTYATNVMGTVHVLEAARHCGTTKVIVNVTTDKCYENKEWLWGYREDEPMGGHDPYSSSKGASELVTSAYRRSFFDVKGIALASARAGNVIGGGDWSQDRLVPDILRAFERNESVVIRNPLATRPWQHVLEPLSGYLLLAERLFTDGRAFAEGWNFGPADDDARPVQWIVEHMIQKWGDNAHWQFDQGHHPHEANYLKLDISKSKARLKWKPRWSLSTALDNIVDWHHAYLSNSDMRTVCLEQIKNFQKSSQI